MSFGLIVFALGLAGTRIQADDWLPPILNPAQNDAKVPKVLDPPKSKQSNMAPLELIDTLSAAPAPFAPIVIADASEAANERPPIGPPPATLEAAASTKKQSESFDATVAPSPKIHDSFLPTTVASKPPRPTTELRASRPEHNPIANEHQQVSLQSDDEQAQLFDPGRPQLPSYLQGDRLPLDQQVFKPDMSVTQGLPGPPAWAIGFPSSTTGGGYRAAINGTMESRQTVDPNYRRVLDLYPDGNNRRLIEQVRKVVHETEVGVDVTDEQWITVRGDGKRITWGGRIDTDWVNWARDEEFGQPNYVEFRRLRLFASGEGYGVYDYQLDLGFAPDVNELFEATELDVEVKDAFIGLRDLPLLGYLMIGHFRVPIGLANTTSSRFIPFMERSLPTRLLPARALGFAAYNASPSENLTWSLGAFFDDLNDNRGAIIDDNQGGRIVGRTTWTPFYDELSHRCFLHTGLGYMYSRPRSRSNPLISSYRPVRFWARPEIGRGTPLIDTGLTNTKQYQTANVELAWVNGPITIQSEMTWTGWNQTSGEKSNLYGAYLYGSWFLTGEQRNYNRRFGTFGRVKPYENFWIVPTKNGHRAGWGAWELATRWSYLSFSDYNQQYLNDLTVGVNWYWNPNCRVMMNWIHPIAHNSPAAKITTGNASGDIIALRMQVDF
ncbi:MAG: hypothetical protein GY768_08965 [Planctomycetaceae bacterium]|nr:hypothetical protein [Planctomycetaceae bacterium]